MLRGCPAVALPALAIGLFCGLRTAEVARLRWEDVDFGQLHVAVRAEDAKTASRRLVPLSDNALDWLLPLRGGPKARVYPKRVTEAAQASRVRRIANGARHSWVTYKVAHSGDVARTASEAENALKASRTIPEVSAPVPPAPRAPTGSERAALA